MARDPGPVVQWEGFCVPGFHQPFAKNVSICLLNVLGAYWRVLLEDACPRAQRLNVLNVWRSLYHGGHVFASPTFPLQKF